MKDVREFIREHKKEVITGALIAGGVIAAYVIIIKNAKRGIGTGTAHKAFMDVDEAIDVFRKFIDASQDAAMFFEKGQITVIDL